MPSEESSMRPLFFTIFIFLLTSVPALAGPPTLNDYCVIPAYGTNLTASQCQDVRDANWDRTNYSTTWESSFTGTGNTASLSTPYHLWWDSPHDDDFERIQGCAFRYNQQKIRAEEDVFLEDGYTVSTEYGLVVDRFNEVDNEPCTNGHGVSGSQLSGNIIRRDEFLRHVGDTGLTLEFRVALKNYSTSDQWDAFQVHFISENEDDATFAVYVSPNCVKLGEFKVVNSLDTRACVDNKKSDNQGVEQTITYAKYGVVKVCSQGSCVPPTDCQNQSCSVVIENTDGSDFSPTWMTTYRVVYFPDGSSTRPNANNLDHNLGLYVNGSSTPLLTAEASGVNFNKIYQDANATLVLGDVEYEFPYILVGDPSPGVGAAQPVTTAFLLSEVKYSRGVYPTGAPTAIPNGTNNSPFEERTAPSLPRNRAASASGNVFQELQFEESNFIDFRDENELVTIAGSWSGAVFNGNSVTLSGDETVTVQNHSATSQTNNEMGLMGNGDWTIEFKAKVNSSAEENGFALVITDHIGSVSVLLSPDAVKLGLGSKILGTSRAIPIVAGQSYVYRLIRRKNEPYIYLYIDSPINNGELAVPALSDFKLSSSQWNGVNKTKGVTIQFGTSRSQVMPLSHDSNGNALDYPDQNIEIEYLKWSSSTISDQP